MIGKMMSQSSVELLLLLQATACIAVGLTGSYLLRHRAARAHQVLLVGLLSAVLLPALYVLVRHFELGVLAARPALVPQEAVEQWINETTDIEELPMAAVGHAAVHPETSELAASPPASPVWAARIPSRRALLTCWAAATALLLGHLAVRFALGLRVLVTSNGLENRDLHAAIAAAQTKVGMDRPVRLRCSDRVRSPIIWCWTRVPVLLVHKQVGPRGDNTDWVGIFSHELAHFKRSDHVSALFAELLTVALPWHPLMWWAKWRLLRLSEEVCDDWAVAHAPTSIDYAESLLELAPERQLAFLPTVVGKEKTMKARIRRIVKDRCGNPRPGARWTFAMTLLAVLATVSVAFAQRRPIQAEQRESEERQEVRERRESEELALAGRRNVLNRMLEQLVAQARKTEATLHERGDGIGEEGHVLRAELEALHEHIQMVERQLHNLDGGAQHHPEADARRQRMRPVAEIEAHAKELTRHRVELLEHAHHMEQELEHVGESQPEAREKLEVELHAIHERTKAIDEELEDLEQPHVVIERRTTRTTRRRDPDASEGERVLSEQLRVLGVEAAEAGRALRRIDDRNGEEARDLAAHIEQLLAQMRNTEKELQAINQRPRPERRVRTRDRSEPRVRAGRGGGWEQVHAGLLEHIRLTEEKLKDLEDQDGPAANRLRGVLEQLHERRQAIERRVEQSGDTPRRPRGIEGEVEELRGKVDGMREEMAQMRRLLERLLEKRAKGNEEVQEMKLY